MGEWESSIMGRALTMSGISKGECVMSRDVSVPVGFCRIAINELAR